MIGNPIELSQVIQNLLGNALKFTPPGGEVSIHAGPSSTAGRVSIAIEDNGPGLSPEVKRKLFQPYTQGPSTQFRNAEGTGLGLSISSELITRLGGELTISSEPGQGVSAIVDVPLETLPDVPPGLRVLVVEDNAVNQFLARRLLQLLGCEAECVPEGSAALELLTSRHFDAILMDCLTPGMDGYATARRIRASPDPVLAATPIIAVTGQDIEQCRHACMESGMDSVIGKPFDLVVLRHELVVALKSGTSTGAELFARSVGSLSPVDEGH